MLNDKAGLIVDEVLKSKRYRALYRPTVRRIVEDCFRRYPEKRVKKEVKRRLHQIWGLAYPSQPDFDKIISRLKQDLKAGLTIKQALLPILALQSSTRERIPHLESFYRKIFAITGNPQKIVEPACGLNALTYPWMYTTGTYLGFDVDETQIRFVNQVVKLIGIEEKMVVRLADVLIDALEPASVTLLLKVLTILEHQKKGISLALLRKLPSEYVVLSFPTKSLSGKEKGMKKYYTGYFLRLVENEPWQIETLVFENELVFIVKKQ